ncbi:MAG: aldehyde dehydrogenase [Bacteroidetes bacterium]|nr:MAG: aldehyde dehydrogenase [Bacteroidota bacterium]
MHSDVVQIIQRHREFYHSRQTLDVRYRIRQLTTLRDLILAFEERIYEALWKDLRKSRFEVYTTEIGMVLSEISLHLRHIRRWSRPERVPSNQLIHFWSSGRIIRQPYGVVLIIAPWNFPFLLQLHPLVGAISAGNCAALKPSEYAPHTAAVVREMLSAGFPDAYISVHEGDAGFSRKLLEGKWDYIFFTGSQRVARLVMTAAAGNLTPVSLELGGKSPCIVESDANLQVAATRISWGKFLNAGQMCIAPDYLFVHTSVKEEFLSRLTEQIRRFFGDDPKQSIAYGRIITQEKTERLVQLLQQSTVLCGGEADPQDRYLAPTVVGNITPEHQLMQEEIFGPILPVLEYQSIDTVIAYINAGAKPLALYYFTEDKRKEKELLLRTSSGGACINDTLIHFANPRLPFGGVGESGIGRYHGKYSFETFSHRRSVMKKVTWIDIPLRYPPYGNRLKLIKRLLK